MKERIHGWGRFPVVEAEVAEFETKERLRGVFAKQGPSLARALGRSYGDASLSPRVVSTLRYERILDFSPDTGVVRCEAGMSLAELVEVFLPRGWFLHVTPGTRFVSVGGAVASDVHGKNHHKAGCFSSGVRSLSLMLADGTVVRCSREENPELFRATCGGMGLTGVILDVELTLVPVASSVIRQRIYKAANLGEVFSLFEQCADWTYSVAWIDCLAKGDDLGRSLLMVGEHAVEGDLSVSGNRGIAVPIDFPSAALNRFTVSMFNRLYYERIRRPMVEGDVGYDSFFYPLDVVCDWNRMYGRRGFLQYQFVAPLAHSHEVLSEVLRRVADAGRGSFLAVLKLFGPANDNYLSFPMEGYTLCLDFKADNAVFGLLRTLDRLVAEAGGRLYLTKDARMSRDMFHGTYPGHGEFARVRKQWGGDAFSSLQSRRLGI